MSIDNIVYQILQNDNFKYMLNDMVSRAYLNFANQSKRDHSEQNPQKCIKNIVNDINETITSHIQIKLSEQTALMYTQLEARNNQFLEEQYKKFETFQASYYATSSQKIQSTKSIDNNIDKYAQAKQRHKQLSFLLINSKNNFDLKNNNQNDCNMDQYMKINEQMNHKIKQFQLEQTNFKAQFNNWNQQLLTHSQTDLKRIKQKLVNAELRLQQKIEQGLSAIWNVLILLQQKFETFCSAKKFK